MTYRITETREFYGPSKRKGVLEDIQGNPETFATKEAALARIEELDNQPYYTSHNESGRPVYKIKK